MPRPRSHRLPALVRALVSWLSIWLLVWAPAAALAGPPPDASSPGQPEADESATTESESSAEGPAPAPESESESESSTEGPAPQPEAPVPRRAAPVDAPLPDVVGEAAVLPGTGCDIRNPGDPLFPVVTALAPFRTRQLELVRCQQIVESGLGRRLIEAQIQGPDQDLMLYRLERLAADGFEIFLTPTGTHAVSMTVRPALSSGGVYYYGIDSLSVHGTFVQGDDSNRVATIIGLREGDFYPFEYATRLAELGYRAEFYPVAKGELVIEVRPGRSIRRVRVRGHVPLAKRDVLRQLSIDSQPGALARGQCVEPKRLRETPRPALCAPKDVACLEWERDEVARLDRFLFDSGYFDGQASLALVCGRARDEADIHVFLAKGKAYKVKRNAVVIHDLDAGSGSGTPLENRDVRWLERQFMPKALGLFPSRITREFMDRAKERVINAYADPNAGLGRFWRSEARTPHPEIEIRTNYDNFTAETKHEGRRLDMDVFIARGPAVQTEFKPAPGVSLRRVRASGLSFSDGQLRSQIQLFNRREPASSSTAERESANLRAYYQSKGYLFARVSGRHLDFQSLSKLRFEIDEGPKVEVAKLAITRPARLDEDVARRIERTWDKERELRKRGRFSETAALADLQALLAAYNAEGYLCADAYVHVAFWDEALAQARGPNPPTPGTPGYGEWATIRIADLLDGGGEAKWLEPFNDAGLAAIMDQDRAKIWVRFDVDPGPRFVTSTSETLRFLDQPIPFARKIVDPVTRDPVDEALAREALDDSVLRLRNRETPGQVPITLALGRELRRSVVADYRNGGYPVSDAELTWSYISPSGQTLAADTARTLTESRFGICQGRRTEAQIAVEPVVNIYEGKEGEFGEILFRGNFKTREWVLRRELAFNTGERYDQSQVDASAASIESAGVAKSVTITPYPVDCEHDTPGVCQVHEVVTIEEAKDIAMAIDFGFGSATLNPFYLFANPRFPNLWGTAWDFSLEGRYGFDLSEQLQATDLCAGQECYERLAAATLSRPHVFGSSLDLDINGRIQQRATPARGQIVSVNGSLRVSRRFESWTFYAGYLIQLANVSKDIAKPLAGTDGSWINRSGGVVSDLTGLIDTGVVLTRADNAFNPHEGYLATMDIKLASPWLGGNDWWARLDLSWQHFIPLPIPGTQERFNFRYSLRYGHLLPFSGPGFQNRTIDTRTVPDVWRYYGGGTADLGIRGILPETMLVDVERVELPYGGVIYRPRAQGGHIRALATVALQVTSVRNIFGGALAHSLFYDFGVLTQFWDKVDLSRDFRHSAGINFIKLDIGIVTMALGYAFLIPGGRNVGPTDDSNGRVIFDVGVTF